MNVAVFKDSIREAAGFKCQRCGMTQRTHLRRRAEKLHVHRPRPSIQGGEYVHGNAEALCYWCHRKEHKTTPKRIPGVAPAKSQARIVLVTSLENADRLRDLVARFNRRHCLPTSVSTHVAKALALYMDSEERKLASSSPSPAP